MNGSHMEISDKIIAKNSSIQILDFSVNMEVVMTIQISFYINNPYYIGQVNHLKVNKGRT